MFECKAIEKTTKTGKSYVCLVVTFPNGYEKYVFLDLAEQYLAMLK